MLPPPMPLPDPSDLHPTDENVLWTKSGICQTFAESIHIGFSKSSSGGTRRNMRCLATRLNGKLLLLWQYGTAMGYEALSDLARLFGLARSNNDHALRDQLYAIVITIFVIELMALDEELTNELPEEITSHPEFCSAIREWLPVIGQSFYDRLIQAEDRQSEDYSNRRVGKPFVPEAVTAS